MPTPKPGPIDTSGDLDPNHLTKLSSNLSVASSTDPTLVEGDGREYAASIASDTDAASTKSKRSWFKKRRSLASGFASVRLSYFQGSLD